LRRRSSHSRRVSGLPIRCEAFSRSTKEAYFNLDRPCGRSGHRVGFEHYLGNVYAGLPMPAEDNDRRRTRQVLAVSSPRKGEPIGETPACRFSFCLVTAFEHCQRPYLVFTRRCWGHDVNVAGSSWDLHEAVDYMHLREVPDSPTGDSRETAIKPHEQALQLASLYLYTPSRLP
jgi:hypothetical protein